MTEVYKPFDQKLYDENDLQSKELVAHFLVSTGVYELIEPVRRQAEMFKDGDFRIRNRQTEKDTIVEVERKVEWEESGVWHKGWKVCNVPYRKRNSKAEIYTAVNTHFDTIVVCPFNTVLESETWYTDTTYTKNERFFRVELKDLRLYFISAGYKWFRGTTK